VTRVRLLSAGVKLPEADRVIIDPSKLRDYALSPTHSIGRFKAAFFARLGFTSANWESLEVELRRLASQEEADPGGETSFGRKYVVRGAITGPTGASAAVLTVWIVLRGEQVPRLVTIYPED
jgi:hypothetical protein